MEQRTDGTELGMVFPPLDSVHLRLDRLSWMQHYEDGLRDGRY
jgi:hypothetical protein